jgi:hypothetical protein
MVPMGDLANPFLAVLDIKYLKRNPSLPSSQTLQRQETTLHLALTNQIKMHYANASLAASEENHPY